MKGAEEDDDYDDRPYSNIEYQMLEQQVEVLEEQRYENSNRLKELMSRLSY